MARFEMRAFYPVLGCFELSAGLLYTTQKILRRYASKGCVSTLSLCGRSCGTTPGQHSYTELHAPTASERSLYGAWTQNFPHDPPCARGTANPAGVAMFTQPPCWACETEPDCVT